MHKVDLRRYIEDVLHERVLAAERAYRQMRSFNGSDHAQTGCGWGNGVGGAVACNATELYRLALQNFSEFLLYQKLPPAEYLLLPFLKRIVEATHADCGNIQVFDASQQVLKITAQCGFHQPFLDFFANVSDERGTSCGAAFKTARRIVVSDVRQSDIFAKTPALEVLLRAGVKACQSTPLLGPTGTLIGILSTHYCEPTMPSEGDLVLIDEVTPLMADFLTACTLS